MRQIMVALYITSLRHPPAFSSAATRSSGIGCHARKRQPSAVYGLACFATEWRPTGTQTTEALTAQTGSDDVMTEPKVGANTGNRGKGRRKGVPNKTTALAKEAIATAAANLGGADRLVAWAKEDPANERAFWSTIYPKLIPVQLNHADADGEKLVVQVVRFADHPAS